MKRKQLKTAILFGLMAASISMPVWAESSIPKLYSNTDETKEIINNSGDAIVNETINVANDLVVTATSGNGIYAGDSNPAKVNILANNVTIRSGQNGIFTTWGDSGIEDPERKGLVSLGSEERNITGLTIEAKGQGIDNKKGLVTIYGSEKSQIAIHSGGYNGAENDDQSAINAGRHKENQPITDGTTIIEGGTITLSSDGGSGIVTRTENSSTKITAQNSISISSNHLHPEEPGTYKTIENAGINNIAGTTTVTANNGITITSSKSGILAQSGTVNMTSTSGNNVIEAAREDVNTATIMDAANSDNADGTADSNDSSEKLSYGSKHAIKAENKSQVHVSALGGDNKLYGVIYAKDDDTAVTVDHNTVDSEENAINGKGSNYIYSSAHGSTDDVGDRSNVVAALYAQNKGEIQIAAGTNGINYIETYYPGLENAEETKEDEKDQDSEHTSERTVWAQQGGQIDITGTTIIKSSNAENFYEGGYATNSRGIAITAGTGIDLTNYIEDGVLTDVEEEDRSSVDLKYGPAIKIGKNTYNSAIYGDIVSGYGGDITIQKLLSDEEYGISIQGNILAGNGGILNVDLGEGGIWYGRADDYGDAGYGEAAVDKQNFYSPVFSDTIYTGGTVNITMGEGSKWYLTGQSWVSSLDVSQGNGNVTIDMAQFNEGTHGLTISELKGTSGGNVDATFIMDLDHTNHSTSDMLYIKNGTGEYDVVLNTMIDGIETISEDNVLRFATVQGGASFNSVTMKNTGLYNLGFEIDHSAYSTEAVEENTGYNGTTVNKDKPGNENVEGFFDLDNGNDTNTQRIMLLDETASTADSSQDVQNWYITKVLGQELSDGGKTVVNMSRVNYSNAVYMDRLNKRLGEARYIDDEEDQGMWVRIRHDRVGKDDAFRLQNTMYELGYDKKRDCDNGERRTGVAIDYMDGSSDYTSVSGSGDISRKGIWLYDTWLGDKGHYSDFVAKWGHLSNDFTLYRGGDKITGDYSNDVYSISAEYGRKKDIGNNWYFEPQAQLQYARVTGANYTTSQGTEVDLDAIDSLIVRAGFRLGKDLGERSTIYFKADVLHEFLGDQDIYAADGTGSMNVTYGNKGTWCDVGFGFAAAISNSSYAYLDVETSLGNDYEDTYQINAGLQWSFS